VVGLSGALRVEATPHGVTVSVLCPGVIRTPIVEGGRYGRLEYEVDEDRIRETWKRLRPMAPEFLAAKVMRAVDRNRAIIIVPGGWKIFWCVDRLSPWLDRGMRRQLEEMIRS
jgi:short-subunit dehydrogenase